MTAERRRARRFFDVSLGAWVVKVFPGEYYVTNKGRRGSGHGAGLMRCPHASAIRARGIGGMNHFMLPEGEAGGWGGTGNAARYGNFAMEKLINELLKLGCAREALEIKVFGGGNVTDTRNLIGTDNSRFRDALSRKRKSCLCRAGSCAASTRAAFNISRRPAGSFAAC